MRRADAYLCMAIGRPTKPLNVTTQEKEKLSMLAHPPKSAQAAAMRARIVLGCNDGLSNGEVAKRLRSTGATVCRWRERFRPEAPPHPAPQSRLSDYDIVKH